MLLFVSVLVFPVDLFGGFCSLYGLLESGLAFWKLLKFGS